MRVLDFGLAQFDEADTLTAVGDVPGTLAYISPERLGGEEASERSDVWAVGVILWEALAGSHPFWGVPLPEVASTIASGAPPLSARRGDLPRRLLAAVDSALSVDPAKRPTAARLAAELREAFVVARHPRPTSRRPRSRKPTTQSRPRAAEPAVPLERRLAPAGLAAIATLVGGSLLPFWPAALLAVLAVAAGLTTLRAPRLGLALTLATPLFALGNVAQAAAVVYGALALAWLAVTWRDARAGLLFCAGPLLAPLGLLALLPLAVQPARGAWRRALHAGVGVLAAAAVAGLVGAPAATRRRRRRRPRDRAERAADRRAPRPRNGDRDATGLATTALALAVVAALLPRATARGYWGIAGLGALQLRSSSRGRPRSPGRASFSAPGSSAACWPPGLAVVVGRCSRPSPSARGTTLDSIGGGAPFHERPSRNREQDRGPLRRGLRACLPDARAAGRARPEAREGDGRASLGLGLARLRPERVHAVPLAPRTARSSPRTRARSSASSRSTWSSTPGARATPCSPRHASSWRRTTTSRWASSGSRRACRSRKSPAAATAAPPLPTPVVAVPAPRAGGRRARRARPPRRWSTAPRCRSPRTTGRRPRSFARR